MKYLVTVPFFCLLTFALFAQSKVERSQSSYICSIQGVVSNNQNGNLLPDAIITVLDDTKQERIGSTKTDVNGFYQLNVPNRDRYRILCNISTCKLSTSTPPWRIRSTL